MTPLVPATVLFGDVVDSRADPGASAYTWGSPTTPSPRDLAEQPEAPMPLANIIGPELLIVLAIALVLFGSSRLPQLARSLGSAKNEFERGLSGTDDERDRETAS